MAFHQGPLVPDLWIAAFRFMGIKDLLSVSQTCTTMRLLVKAYWPIAFNLTQTLQPFLKADLITSFRLMLKASGGIVSGSTALQFLDRTAYSSSDMDIYVSSENCAILERWLLDHGMKKIRNDSIEISEYDRLREITSISDFQVPDSPKLIQLIGTKRNPVYAVLGFHSSCVMNFISYDTAYSLYPYSTFCDRRSLVWGFLSQRERGAAGKYATRGWIVKHHLVKTDYVVLPSELEIKKRTVGDPLCWSFHLDTGARGKEWKDDDNKISSWSIGYSKKSVVDESDPRRRRVEGVRASIEVDDGTRALVPAETS